MKRRDRQRKLEFVGHGGKRRGAGRKLAKGKRRTVSHRRRTHGDRHPIHVTLRFRDDLPNMRERNLYLTIEDAIRAGRERFGFRVIEWSVQGNHLHLIVEADSERALSRGMQGLAIRVARALNRALSRHGKVFADRFHARDLRTPTEVRNALVYVLNNAKHHAKDQGQSWPRRRVDPYSSAAWFTGWASEIESRRLPGPSPAASAKTWLLRTGWRRLGMISPSEMPKESRSTRRRPTSRPGTTRPT